jgi:4-hydroxyphenylpyruvate dioxygenase
MRTAIATVCLSGTLEEKLVAAAEAGFDGVEIFEPDLIASPLSPEQVRERATDLGLTLDLYQPVRDVEAVPEEQFEANLRRVEGKFRLMRRLGTDTVLVCSNVGTATVGDDRVMAEQLRRLGDLAQTFDIRVAYEALAWGSFVDTYGHAWRLVEEADHPHVGLCLDSFHTLSRGDDPLGIGAIPGDKIFFLQLSDAPALSMDVLSWSRHHRLFPGEGTFDLPRFLGQVLKAGYRGPVSLEVFNDVFRQADEQRTAVEAMRSLLWLEDQTARRFGSPEPVPAGVLPPAPGRGLATLPDVEDPSGVNFVEVKTDRPGDFERLLQQLGFDYAGRHQSKPVDLWTQGSARAVINGQGAQHWEPTIAAIGLDVRNPQASATRALHLRAATVPRPARADEEVLQAVSAPDGTEVFLCQATPDGTATWAGEFGVREDHPTVTGATAGGTDPAAISRIDHVNLAHPWQHFDEAVLFYSSALSLDAVVATEVPGPSGLVRSQVMRSSDGSVRLALNVAPHGLDRPGTDTKKVFPQHVAFACNDLVEFARRARARGLEFLHIPANYYDDLAARFDLDAEELETLRELHLLYDRDGQGEFLHFYTATVGNVFLEVVERRGGYEGYGAPNAPIRLAAQYERRRQRRS